jgi:hypothetical protein
MIVMAMGIQQQNGFQVIAFDEINNGVLILGCIHPRINDHALIGFIINNISILAYRIVFKSLHISHVAKVRFW